MGSAVVVSVLVLASSVPAQLRISEVLIDPPGPTGGGQMIELINTSDADFWPNGWSLWTSSGMAFLPSIDLPPGPVLLQIGGLELSKNAHRIYLPELRPTDTLVLLGEEYPDDNPRVMEDFVSWGGGTVRISEAVAVGQWSDATDTVPLPDRGQTIARLNAGNGLQAWYVDSSPTLGLANEPARYGAIVGRGCPGSTGTPTLQATALPWRNDYLTVDIGNLPRNGVSTFGVMVTGLDTQTPHLDLGPFGLPDCTLHVQILANSFFAVRDGVARWSLPIPDIPSLEGLRFFNQALVQDLAAGNPRQAVLSDAVSGIIGDK